MCDRVQVICVFQGKTFMPFKPRDNNRYVALDKNKIKNNKKITAH